MKIKRYKVECRIEKMDENAFQLIKINEEEQLNVFKLYSSLPILHKFVRLLKTGKRELLNRDIIK